MIRLTAAFAVFAAAAAAQSATDLLARAHSAFVQNSERDRYWTWTTVTNRALVDRAGKVLQSIPSVTVDSPIRSDGKRCNAVLAWGDGQQPYLANATADQRCTVEAELPNIFRLEALLQSGRVHVESNGPGRITLALGQDSAAAKSDDPVVRCIGAMKASVRLDPQSYFPTDFTVTAVTAGCQLKNQTSTDHYTDAAVPHTSAGQSKGSVLEFHYELQKDKSGDPGKDFWICTRRKVTRPWLNSDGGMLVWGRLFQTRVKGADRLVVTGDTTARELSAQSLLKFETAK